MIHFDVLEEGCDFFLCRDNLHDLSESTKSMLLKFSKCLWCGNNIKKDFSPCSCVAKHKKNRRGYYRITEEQYKHIEAHLKKEKRRAYSRKGGAIRKERLSKAGGKHTTDEDIYRIWELQDGKCYFCWKPIEVSFPELDGTPTLPLRELYEIEHLTPISKGGTDWPYNIALTCKECNRRKSDRNEASFWRLLEKEHGEKWVSKRKARATKNMGAKRKLTNIRKKEAKVL